jgi:hypothetical protein
MIYGEIKLDRVLEIGIIPKNLLNYVVDHLSYMSNATRVNSAVSHSCVH